MKILSTNIEPGRGSRASVEIVIRVNLDGSAAKCEVTGRVVGPLAKGMTTVEVEYALVPVKVSDNAVSLKCVIPEPSLWTRETPFSYAWSISVEVNGEETDSSSGALAFPAPK
jgi:Glycosyl hydrolases family 2